MMMNKFKVWDCLDRKTNGIKSDYKGWYKQQGYIMQKAIWHPYANSRGYVQEHRLIIEKKLKRYLIPNVEFIHHIDQDRSNNVLSNLKLEGGQHLHAKGHLPGKRNPHGQFICKDPIFHELKFRLKNIDTGLINIYTLNQLIATTWRKGCFEFQGRYTGLKDKKGVEIYEEDIIKGSTTRFTSAKYIGDNPIEREFIGVVKYRFTSFVIEFQTQKMINKFGGSKFIHFKTADLLENIGSIHTNPELLK